MDLGKRGVTRSRKANGPGTSSSKKKYRRPHPIRHWNFAVTPGAENYERRPRNAYQPAATHNLFTIAERKEEPKRRHTRGTILKLDNHG